MSNITTAANPNGGTGPYRRIYSDEGFSAVRATVFLPGVTQGGIVYAPGGDTAFIYSGGWGSEGQALDAGFMHNPGTDTWSVFIKFQGNPEYLGPDPAVRLTPNQTVTFTFFVPQDGSIRIETAGDAVRVLDAQNQTPLGQTPIAIQYDGASGFPQSGEGVVVKRMTSIAQQPEALGDGSKLVGVHWSAVQLGTDPNGLNPWSITPPGGATLYPDAARVQSQKVSGSEEIVTIDLS